MIIKLPAIPYIFQFLLQVVKHFCALRRSKAWRSWIPFFPVILIWAKYRFPVYLF